MVYSDFRYRIKNEKLSDFGLVRGSSNSIDHVRHVETACGQRTKHDRLLVNNIVFVRRENIIRPGSYRKRLSQNADCPGTFHYGVISYTDDRHFETWPITRPKNQKCSDFYLFFFLRDDVELNLGSTPV